MTTERRIRHPRKYEELFKLLIEDKNNVFASKAQVLLFAAAVGFNAGKRTPFADKDSYEPIRMATFDNLGRNFQMVLNSLAVAETKDIKILSSDHFDDRVLIFEEYAANTLGWSKFAIRCNNQNVDRTAKTR